MNQTRLERAVARATGESRSTIHHLGFGLLDPTGSLDDLDERPTPLTVDWDRLDAKRTGFVFQRSRCAL
jgi:hypothetical protein